MRIGLLFRESPSSYQKLKGLIYLSESIIVSKESKQIEFEIVFYMSHAQPRTQILSFHTWLISSKT